MVAATDLIDEVLQDWFEHCEAVFHSARGSWKVDDHRGPGHAGKTARQHRSRYAVRDAVSANGLGDAGKFTVDKRFGGFGGAVGRVDAGSPVVRITSGLSGNAAPIAWATGSPSPTMVGPVTANPQAVNAATIGGPVVSS